MALTNLNTSLVPYSSATTGMDTREDNRGVKRTARPENKDAKEPAPKKVRKELAPPFPNTPGPVANIPHIDHVVTLLSGQLADNQNSRLREIAQDLCTKAEGIFQVHRALAASGAQKDLHVEVAEPAVMEFFCDANSVRAYLTTCECGKKGCTCDDLPEGGTKKCLPALRVLFTQQALPVFEPVAKLVVTDPSKQNLREVAGEIDYFKMFAGRTERLSQLYDANPSTGTMYVKKHTMGILDDFMFNNLEFTYEANSYAYRLLFCDILEGLSALEAMNVVHLDFTERNIILNKDGQHLRATIIDFQDMGKLGSVYTSADPSNLTSPECLIGDLGLISYRLDNKMNVWTAGLLFHYMMFKSNIHSNGLVEIVGHFNRLRTDCITKVKKLPPSKPRDKIVNNAGVLIQQARNIVNEMSIDTLSTWGVGDRTAVNLLKEQIESLKKIWERLLDIDKRAICSLESNLRELCRQMLQKLMIAWEKIANIQTEDQLQQLICQFMLNPDPNKRKSATELHHLFKQISSEEKKGN